MITPIAKREPPNGFVESWDSATWNTGFLFQWSEVYQRWIDQGILVTVKPGQCLAEAFRARIDRNSTWREGWYTHFNIYFAKDN